MTPRFTRRAALQTGALSALTLLAAACSGSSGDSGATTPASTPSDGTGDTIAPSSTDVDTTSADTAAPTTAGSTVPGQTTTTVPAGPVYPLTGLPITDEAKALRPAMVVKIDNHPEARPQFGLNIADIVFEENVESLTRFAAVFQSQDTDRIGPVRSGRTQDVILLGSFDHPMFVWSGGNANVTRTINGSDLINLSPTTTKNTGFFRAKRGSEHSEHTLYVHPLDIWAGFTRVYAPAPPAQFTYRTPEEAFNGEPASGVDLDMDGVKVNWTWDTGSTSYLRKQGGKSHDVAEGGQVDAVNVVVVEVDYRPSPADARSPEAQTTGTGTAYVFTGGVLIRGTWKRDDRLQPFTLTDADGAVIALTPGRTWVELARVKSTTPIV